MSIKTSQVSAYATKQGIKLKTSVAKQIAKTSKTISEMKMKVDWAFGDIENIRLPKGYKATKRSYNKITKQLNKAIKKYTKTHKQKELNKVWQLKITRNLIGAMIYNKEGMIQMKTELFNRALNQIAQRKEPDIAKKYKKSYATTDMDTVIRENIMRLDLDIDSSGTKYIDIFSLIGDKIPGYQEYKDMEDGLEKTRKLMELVQYWENHKQELIVENISVLTDNAIVHSELMELLENAGVIEPLAQNKLTGKYGYRVVDTGEIISPE